MARVEAIVVGGGVVGLAIGRALARGGRETLILEREAQFGAGTSSRNSEVVHAGLYYPPGSLKARLCVEGRDRLYDFCRRRGVPHRAIGKLIVAFGPDQSGELDAIEARAAASGGGPLRRLGRAELAALEPALDVADALFSPRTGIVDSHALMLALLGEAEAQGARLVCGADVEQIARRTGAWAVHLAGEREAIVEAPLLVNAAGLQSQALAARTEGLDPRHVPPLHLARGSYFACSGRTPFRHLVYPVPEPGGLGIHLTLDLAGQARFGPDVEWINSLDYRVDPARKPGFAAAARRIWPALDPDRLQPAFAGIRPKLAGPGAPPADFAVSTPAEHGLEGLVNLFGIESPGLTAALALAEHVRVALDLGPDS